MIANIHGIIRSVLLTCLLFSTSQEFEIPKKNQRTLQTCPAGQYYYLSRCVACTTGCTKCSSSSSCQLCSPGYYRSSTSKCSACYTYCATCTSYSYCNACKPGYYLKGSTCSACKTNCLSCSTSTNCLECKSGYTLSSNSCSYSKTTTESSSSDTPFSSIGGIGGFLGILFGCLVCFSILVAFMVFMCKKMMQARNLSIQRNHVQLQNSASMAPSRYLDRSASLYFPSRQSQPMFNVQPMVAQPPAFLSMSQFPQPISPDRRGPPEMTFINATNYPPLPPGF